MSGYPLSSNNLEIISFVLFVLVLALEFKISLYGTVSHMFNWRSSTTIESRGKLSSSYKHW